MAFNRGATWATDVTPATGDTIQVPVADGITVTCLAINNAGLLASVTLSFPVAGVQDCQAVELYWKNPVTLIGSIGATVQGLITTLTTGGVTKYRFRASNSTWYRN